MEIPVLHNKIQLLIEDITAKDKDIKSIKNKHNEVLAIVKDLRLRMALPGFNISKTAIHNSIY